MLREIKDYVKKNNGITFNFQGEYLQNSGYAVSEFPKRTRTVKSLTDRYLIHYIHCNYDKLTNDNYCLGIWYHNGYYIFDVVSIYYTRKKAVEAGIKHNQIAIYDLANERELSCHIEYLM